ncbi:MAG: hypothetical protein EHM23_12375 [Acidobacteria bacterium]|nr:MAG: hypothetical protein EHM23_12375 [Acidobacteriota bacterium]
MRTLEAILVRVLTDREFLNRLKRGDPEIEKEYPLNESEREVLTALLKGEEGQGLDALVGASAEAMAKLMRCREMGLSSEVRGTLLSRVVPKLERVAPKLERTVAKLERVSPKLERAAPKLERVAPKLEQVAPKLERVAPKLERVAPKLERVEGKLARVEAKLARLEATGSK